MQHSIVRPANSKLHAAANAARPHAAPSGDRPEFGRLSGIRTKSGRPPAAGRRAEGTPDPDR